MKKLCAWRNHSERSPSGEASGDLGFTFLKAGEEARGLRDESAKELEGFHRKGLRGWRKSGGRSGRVGEMKLRIGSV